nr:hypothetical protein [uncultured Noviherbaspirillum sp.]
MLIPLVLWGGQAHALGLGAISLQSGLGRPLEARIPVYGLGADDAGASCVKARMMALEGGLLARPVADVTGSGGAAVLNLRTTESINEPAFNVSVEIGCTSSVKREYQVLLDPVPATLPMAAAALAPAGKPERVQRKTASQAGNTTAAVAPEISPLAASAASALPATKPPASAARKPAAPPRPKPAAETKSVLTLSGGDAEIEQVRARLALRSATTLSEPRMEADPARLAALRADQARVAALLRGEDPLAGTQAQLRDTQEKLLAAQKSAASAARLHEQEKAALTAAQEDMVSGKLLALLGGLLAACAAVIGWLLWRRADDRRRQEQAFFAMAVEPEVAPAMPSGQQQQAELDDWEGTPPKAAAAPATPAPVASIPSREAEAPMDFALPQEHIAPAPATALPEQGYQWRTEATLPTVSSAPPEPLHLSDSWFTLENHAEDQTGQALEPGTPALALPSVDDNAQAHAAEVASLLTAAESWMAEHNPLRAVEVLRPYLDRAEMQSPAPALYLLSLYRTMDDKGQIATVLAQLQQDFPVEAAAWGDAAQPRRSMADFPLVHAAVDSLSDSDKLLPYLDSLLLAPEHFDFSTYREIVRAIGLANEMKQESEMQSMSLDFR